MSVRLADGHLDLAFNALRYERDQRLSVEAIRAREQGGVADGRGTSTTSLDELAKAGAVLVVSTVLARCKPWLPAGRPLLRDGLDYPDTNMAHAVAAGELAYYRLLERQGELVILSSQKELKQHLELADVGPVKPGLILTMEGADPIVDEDDLAWWHAAGLRTLMLAHFGRSRFAHGTPSSDPANTHDVDGRLLNDAAWLLPAMAKLGMPLDLTHLSDASFAEAAGRFEGQIYSSHSGARAVTEQQRNHTDEQLRTILQRGGVVGVPACNLFLEPDYGSLATPAEPVPVSMDRMAEHLDHICQVAGSAQQAAIGSDLDGGFGAEHTPREIQRHRDLHKLGAALADRGYGDADTDAILFGNWARFWAESLPD